jgi:hypothetical protein
MFGVGFLVSVLDLLALYPCISVFVPLFWFYCPSIFVARLSPWAHSPCVPVSMFCFGFLVSVSLCPCLYVLFGFLVSASLCPCLYVLFGFLFQHPCPCLYVLFGFLVSASLSLSLCSVWFSCLSILVPVSMFCLFQFPCIPVSMFCLVFLSQHPCPCLYVLLVSVSLCPCLYVCLVFLSQIPCVPVSMFRLGFLSQHPCVHEPVTLTLFIGSLGPISLYFFVSLCFGFLGSVALFSYLCLFRFGYLSRFGFHGSVSSISCLYFFVLILSSPNPYNFPLLCSPLKFLYVSGSLSMYLIHVPKCAVSVPSLSRFS